MCHLRCWSVLRSSALPTRSHFGNLYSILTSTDEQEQTAMLTHSTRGSSMGDHAYCSRFMLVTFGRRPQEAAEAEEKKRKEEEERARRTKEQDKIVRERAEAKRRLSNYKSSKEAEEERKKREEEGRQMLERERAKVSADQLERIRLRNARMTQVRA